jgi:hypothetical protein
MKVYLVILPSGVILQVEAIKYINCNDTIEFVGEEQQITHIFFSQNISGIVFPDQQVVRRT